MSQSALRSLAILVVLLLLSTTSSAQESGSLRVLFAADTEAGLINELISSTRETILEIAADGESWVFVEEVVFADATSPGELEQRIRRSDADLIIGFGPRVTEAAQEHRPAGAKAITAGIVHPVVQNVPYDEETDTSGLEDFTYVWPTRDFDAEIAMMREVREVNELLLVYPESLGLSEPERHEIATYLAETASIDATFRTEEDIADAGTAGVDADFAYLLDVPGIDIEMFREVTSVLTQAGIPTFAYDRSGVEAGAMMSLYRPENQRQLVRRIAIRAQQVALGQSLADKEVSIPSDEQRSFNLRTAEEAGVAIPYSMLITGTVVQSASESAANTVTLDGAISRVIDQNLSYVAQQSTARGRFEAIKQARARLLPSLTLQVNGILIDEDRARASLGQQAQFTITPSLTLEQIIWSEPAYAGLQIQQARALAAQAEVEAFRLDLIKRTVEAYIGLAKLDARVGLIEDSNQRLEARLRSAERRKEVGQSGPADVYRLRSELAAGRTDLIDAIVQREQTQIALNTLMNQPAGTEIGVSPDIRENYEDYGFARGVTGQQASPSSLRRLRDELTRVAWGFAPEMRQLQHAMAARERQLRSAERSYWNPTVGVQAEASYTGARFGTGEDRTPDFELPQGSGGLGDLGSSFPVADDWDWSVGVNVTLPLVRGGQRIAEERVAEEELAAIDARLAETRNQLEMRVHTSVNTVVGRVLAYDLAGERLQSAQQTFELVSDAYSEGAATVVDVVDAETALRAAEIARTVAFYDIVAADFDLQRALGVFARDMTDEQRTEILEAAAEANATGEDVTSTSEP